MRQMDHARWLGIDNVHSSLEMQQLYSSRDGTKKYLVNATNVDFSDGGDIYSRQGTLQRVAGKHTNAIGYGRYLLAVQNGSLRAYDTGTWNYVTLVGVSSLELGHTKIGDELYVSDGVSKWRITPELQVQPWGDGIGDVTFDPQRVRVFPACSKLTYLNGRMFGAIDNFVIYSEPYRYDLTDPMKNFYQFSSKVSMVYANREVLIVSADRTYVIMGAGSAEPQLEAAFAFPSPAGLPGVDPETNTAYWMTERGWVSLKESDKMPTALTYETVCSRRAQSSSIGVIKRAGVTAVVAVSTPDPAYPSTNPLMSADFLESEQNRQEV